MDLFYWVTTVIKVAFVFVMLFQVAPIMAWVERRGSALIQNRLGPNRIGPLGIFQSICDGIKFAFKEDPIPGHVDKFWYELAPLVSLVPALTAFAVIPFAGTIDLDGRLLSFQVADLNVGLLYVFSIASLGVYGIIMAGWSSNNKYSLLGGLRSASQMISYELSMALSVIGIVMVYSSVHLPTIVAGQAAPLFHIFGLAIPKWGIFIQPLGFLISCTAAFAETNRLPFDLPEGESEIIAGYHLEYGSLKFSSFMMAEYMNMATASGLMTTLFFGGYGGLEWLVPYLPFSGQSAAWAQVALQFAAFSIKLCSFMWFFVWVRWTLPRFRYDQLMNLGWKVMLPLSLLNIFGTGVAIYLGWI